MKPNESKLRQGSYKQREFKCTRRVRIMRDKREQGMTWGDIGKVYGISRQAAHKFYKENMHLLGETNYDV